MDGSCSEKSSDEDHAVVALCDHPLAPRGTFTGTTWHRAAAGASERPALRGGRRTPTRVRFRCARHKRSRLQVLLRRIFSSRWTLR